MFNPWSTLSEYSGRTNKAKCWEMKGGGRALGLMLFVADREAWRGGHCWSALTLRLVFICTGVTDQSGLTSRWVWLEPTVWQPKHFWFWRMAVGAWGGKSSPWSRLTEVRSGGRLLSVWNSAFKLFVLWSWKRRKNRREDEFVEQESLNVDSLSL